MSNHKYVLVESPFAGEVEENLAYAQKCMRHVFFSGHLCDEQQIPIASHCFFTLALDDHNPHERTIGMQAGFAMRSLAAETRVYLDRGLSAGMIHGIRHAIETGKTISLWAFDPDRRSRDPREAADLAAAARLRPQVPGSAKPGLRNNVHSIATHFSRNRHI